jgi:hypothetical protein
MPPSDEPQLTKEEIALLKWWIAEGASETLTVAAAKKTPDIEALLGGALKAVASKPVADKGKAEEKPKPKPLSEDEKKAVAAVAKKLQAINASLMPLAQDNDQQRLSVINAADKFSDKELANKANFTELRDKLSKDWKSANSSYIPGVPNIDLVSSDEYMMGLIRDGFKFREGPKVKNAGGSLAATSKPVARAKTSPTPPSQQLQERAAKGDKNAARDLLATMLAANRTRRG